MQIASNKYNPLELDDSLYETIQKDIDTVDQQRKERLAQVVSKFASTLLSRQINVAVETKSSYSQNNNGNSIPSTEAWSDAENIWFNGDLLGNLTDQETALAVRGLSLHEIAHILLTPRAGSNLVKWVRNNGYEQVFNILEDQRVELFLSARYSNVKYWFTASVAKYLLSKPNHVPIAHLLLRGRAYLPQDLRDAVRNAFQWPGIVNDVDRIVDAYTTLNLSDSNSIPMAMSLIQELANLLNVSKPDNSNSSDGGEGGEGNEDSDMPQGNGWNSIPNPHSCIMKSSERSKPANKATQQQLVDKILKQRNQQAQTPTGSEESEEYDKPETTNKGNESGDGKDKSNDTNDSETSAPNKDGNPGTTAGSGNPNGTNNVKEIAQKHLNNNKQMLRQDLSNMVSQFNGDVDLISGKQTTPSRSAYEYTRPVEPAVINQVKSFVNQLQLIKSEHDPGWLRKVNSGKLNVYRYMTGSDADEVFDLWDDGREDVLDIEAVILLDNSGSMSWTIESAHDSMWAIKRSLDKVGASTTVMTFADDARMLYSASEKAKVVKKYVGTAGGTEPRQAINYAKYIFANSERAIKILIVITDGVWYRSEEPDSVIAQMRNAGVITALGYIDYDNRPGNEAVIEQRKAIGQKSTIDGHNAEIVVSLQDGSSLLTLAKALVKAGIKRNLSK
jgi:hypothetical protein